MNDLQNKCLLAVLVAALSMLTTVGTVFAQPTCADTCSCTTPCWYLCYTPWTPTTTINCGQYGLCEGSLDCNGGLFFASSLDLGQGPALPFLQEATPAAIADDSLQRGCRLEKSTSDGETPHLTTPSNGHQPTDPLPGSSETKAVSNEVAG